MRTTKIVTARNGLHRVLAGAALLLLAPLAACVVAVREPVHEVDIAGSREELYATEAPPPPQNEVIVGVAPSPTHIWIGGYWTWHQNGWYWVRGRWAARPRHDAVWVQGRWDHHPRGYVWVGGHWR